MKLLNVGSSDVYHLPPMYADYEEVRLDIDEKAQPDILMDARDMQYVDAFDAVYCSHMLEHLIERDIHQVLRNFWNALVPGGSVTIIVPNLKKVFGDILYYGRDLNDVLYLAGKNEVRGVDILYGFQQFVAEDDRGIYWQHRYGFTPKHLERFLIAHEFEEVVVMTQDYDMLGTGRKPE